MLIEFRCSNHKSIREEILFSMLAGADSAHGEQILPAEDLRLLHTAVIYGANGSGKSNLLDALEQLRAWILGLRPLRQTPHKLAAGTPSRYIVQFLWEEVRYVFTCALCGETVIEESLLAFPGGRRTTVYTRTPEGLHVCSRFRDELAQADLSPSALLASTAAPIPPIAALRRFFGECLVPYHLTAPGERMKDALNLLRRDRVRGAVLALLDTLDTGIVDLRITGPEEAPRGETVYTGFSTDLLEEESSGIRRMIEFLCPLVDMLCTHRVLLCDEPEAHLHELLLPRLIRGIRQVIPESRSQLIFSTHSTGLLDLALFRRDQIWFTELRTEDRSTELYSLAEIRGVHPNENIRLGYLAGEYGAVPLCREGGNGRG
ncbi:MAG: ATP-binding protein [Ruminococcaceae bacterium]|nr:ATP-binding protein [Oscillospiraceae bacterium]